MSDKKSSDQYDEEEAKRRAEKALRGAFKTPPMPKEKEAPRGDKRK
ncbi:MAG: hypothetical protein NVV62_19430 [Terricaulis sp.]|nr:hypothetical protein [Terricaulis sp.]